MNVLFGRLILFSVILARRYVARAGISLEVSYHKGDLPGVELVYLDEEAFSSCACYMHIFQWFSSFDPRRYCRALYLLAFLWSKYFVG